MAQQLSGVGTGFIPQRQPCGGSVNMQSQSCNFSRADCIPSPFCVSSLRPPLLFTLLSAATRFFVAIRPFGIFLFFILHALLVVLNSPFRLLVPLKGALCTVFLAKILEGLEHTRGFHLGSGLHCPCPFKAVLARNMERRSGGAHIYPQLALGRE